MDVFKDKGMASKFRLIITGRLQENGKNYFDDVKWSKSDLTWGTFFEYIR